MNYFDKLKAGLSFTNSTTPVEQNVGLGFNKDPNPFDGFADEAHLSQPQSRPSAPAASPIQAPLTPAQAAPSNTMTDMSPEGIAATENYRSDIAAIFNDTSIDRATTKAQLDARMRQEGLSINDIQYLDKSLDDRDRLHHTVTVGIKSPDAPTEYHGADKGRIDALGTGIADSLTLGSLDEIGGAIGATEQSFGNTLGLGNGKSWSDNYRDVRDQNRQALDDAQHYHPGYYLGGQVLGGVASLPVGGGEAALAAGGLRAAGRLATEGAALGGVYGFNSSNGDLTDNISEAEKGALLGGIGGLVLGAPANAVANRIAANRAAPSVGRELLNAADRLNAQAAPEIAIRPLPGMTSDGGALALGHALLQPTVTGGLAGGLQHATQEVEQRAGQHLGRIADDAAGGTATDMVTTAARMNEPYRPGSLAAYRRETQDQATAAFQHADSLGGHEMVEAPRTLSAIDAKLADWRRSPVAPAEESRFVDLRNTLAAGEDGSGNGLWSVAGLRRTRTIFGRSLDAASPDAREAAGALWSPLSHDVQSGLVTNRNLSAAQAYTRANNDFARRSQNVEIIDKIVGRTPGDHSADAVAGKLMSMSGNDYDRLGRAMRAIDPAQAQEFRGSLVQSLGLPLASRRTGPEDTFSIESFATRWLKMSDQAKAATFQPATVRDLNDLARLSGSQRQVGSLGNPSRSGIFRENYKQGKAIAAETAALTTGVFHPAVWLGLAGSALAGRLLSWPGAARALVRAGEARSIEVLGRRLGEVVRRYPAAEQDVAEFKSTIAGRAVNGVTIDPQTVEQTNSATNPFDEFN